YSGGRAVREPPPHKNQGLGAMNLRAYNTTHHSLLTIVDLHEDFRRRRRSFRLLVFALLAVGAIALLTTPVEESPAGVAEFIFIGAIIAIASGIWAVFRCPNCYMPLPSTFALPGRKECVCPGCGERLGE